MRLGISECVLFLTLGAAFTLAACSDGDGGASSGGSGGGSGVPLGSGFGGSAFNQCGVAAPLPAETGQCTAVTAPTIADFDDYAGAAASGYTFYVNAPPPATDGVRGMLLHIDDGSASGGSSVVTTEMVTGEGDAGYALQISNTNSVNWGGLLMFRFSNGAATGNCLDSSGYGGIEFSIKGSAPSGRFAVTLGMLDTIPAAESGLCSNATASDCKHASLELHLPEDAAAWTKVQVPWSALTPGIGSELSCVPVTGQNIQFLVIQPLMSYPPPDYMFEPGAYSIAVDNLRFY